MTGGLSLTDLEDLVEQGEVDTVVTAFPDDLGRVAGMGFPVIVGAELEFYLFPESYGAARRNRYSALEPSSDYLIDYHLLDTSKDEPLMRAIRNGMNAAGVPVEFSKGEWGRGQHEINLRYAPALEMADRHALYKAGVKEIARQHGAAITFMAKWDAEAAGSSCHLH